MMMVTLRCPQTGKMACIPQGDNVANYAGWTVLGSHEGLPPEHANWADGQGWVVDHAKKAAADEEARLNTLTRAEFMAEIDAKLAKLMALLANK